VTDLQFPPIDYDAMCLLVAVNAIALLMTYELSLPYYSKMTLAIDKRKLRNVGLAATVLFLITIVIRIVIIVVGP
jgi:hypothetical protein